MKLAERIDQIEKEIGRDAVFYISTPPSVFVPIIENLGSSGLASAHLNTKFASKVIIEKPLVKTESARALNGSINSVEESQFHRIDHLGKETVQTRSALCECDLRADLEP